MRIREHQNWGHGLRPGEDRDINCSACQRDQQDGKEPVITAMKTEEAVQHALGYAAGREDASNIRTAEPDEKPGFMAFADAYADGWWRYRREVVCFMVNCRSAYEAWQASNGQSIYQLASMSEYALSRLASDGDEAAESELNRRVTV